MPPTIAIFKEPAMQYLPSPFLSPEVIAGRAAGGLDVPTDTPRSGKSNLTWDEDDPE